MTVKRRRNIDGVVIHHTQAQAEAEAHHSVGLVEVVLVVAARVADWDEIDKFINNKGYIHIRSREVTRGIDG